MYIVIVVLDRYFPGPLLPVHLLLLLYLLLFSFVHSDSGSHSCAFPLVSPKLMILNARYECAFGCAFVFPRAGAGGARIFVDAGGGESVHVSVLRVYQRRQHVADRRVSSSSL